MSGTGDFLGRRAEGLLHGIGNYRRALGQKDLGNWGFWYSSVWISSCVRSLVSGDSRGWCVDTWVVSNVTPPHLVNKGSGCRQGCTCRTSASHSIFCFALISITRYTSLTNILIPYKEKIFSVLIEAMLCVYGYHLSAP